MKIQEVTVKIPSYIISSQVVVDSVNNPQEQINDQTPHKDVKTNEYVTEGP